MRRPVPSPSLLLLLPSLRHAHCRLACDEGSTFMLGSRREQRWGRCGAHQRRSGSKADDADSEVMWVGVSTAAAEEAASGVIQKAKCE